jgi:hypothetical protein
LINTNAPVQAGNGSTSRTLVNTNAPVATN